MDLSKLKQSALDAIRSAKDAKELEAAKVKYVGRKDGELTNILKSLKDMPAAKKREVGPLANEVRQEIEQALDAKLRELAKKASAPSLDVTRPGVKVRAGHLHPLTKIENDIRTIFAGLNFSVVEGPEVETEHYNFEALNIPANHPAKDMWDTFWLNSQQLLRTHTSPMQIRYMEKNKTPFQIIVPGRVFRFEATDASHEINFHQIEGLMVGEHVSLANFKYVISEFFRQFFGVGTEIRFRPSYFPFVEPGVEVDVKLNGKWLEVMGAGMVHPNVLNAVKLNPKDVRGFAFGMGVERLAMIKYNVPDVRLFYSGDLRFINQF
jgi:phenylalanyl-tRNA synthetase alpha chain